jgi:hypothetical protein
MPYNLPQASYTTGTLGASMYKLVYKYIDKTIKMKIVYKEGIIL